MLFERKNYVRVILCLIVAFFLQSSVFASDQEVVKWSELGEHLVENSVTIESMPVVDCPYAIEGESAEHLVCQVIENTFYKWKEYEFYNAEGEPQRAIEMIEPEASFLTADEALILLNGSKLCECQLQESSDSLVECPCPVEPLKTYNPVYKTSEFYSGTMPLEDSEGSVENSNINMVPGSASAMWVDDEPVTLESVHGADGRVRIAGSTTNRTFPWNVVCYVQNHVSGVGDFRGSGTLVSSTCVLTCGHVVYNKTAHVASTQVKVSAGQYQYSEGGTVYRPYGTVDYSSVHSSSQWQSGGGTEYDYGMIKLQTSFPGISTFMPLQFDKKISAVNVVGFPGAGPGESNSYSMWLDGDVVVGYEGVHDRIIRYMADTSGGQSGAPVYWLDSVTHIRRQIAIHCVGGATTNGGCRLVSLNQSLISRWMGSSTPSNVAYIPYFAKNSAAARWTGVALSSAVSNSVELDYYSNSGSDLGSETKTIGANGHVSFATGTADGTEGWIKISSTAPLNGLAMIGESGHTTMYDIDLKTERHKEFLIPHLDASADWRSTAMICNPNSASATIIYKYYNNAGALVAQKTATIPANGSVQQNLYYLFRQNLAGSMKIVSSQSVTVFLLFDNLKTTWRAGLSAIPLD